MRQPQVNTFSIVAYDPDEQAWGVAVASKFLAAGAVVSWARSSVGAVATQAFAKVGFGPDGLALMEEGLSAEETLARLLEEDPDREHRQVGIVDAQGNVAAFTGSECFDWAGHRTGENYTCQGNILTGEDTLVAMASAFEQAQGDLGMRLVTALLAGDMIGGDSRGKQSAGLLVVKPNGGYGGDNDRYLDLRVDDDADPVNRLMDLVKLHKLYMGKPNPDDLLPIDDALAAELQNILRNLGFYEGEINGQWDERSKEAFWAFCGIENLEERWSPDSTPDHLDRVVLDYIRSNFA